MEQLARSANDADGREFVLENDHGGADRLYRRIRVELRGRRHGDERVLADPHCDLIHYHAKQNDRRLGNDGHKGVNMENAKVDNKRRKNFLNNIKDIQVIITCTEKITLENLKYFSYNVIDGNIKEE